MRIRSASCTNVGLVRKNNEDRCLVDDKNGLYAVADGMGGHSSGEVAASLAIETLRGRSNRSSSLLPIVFGIAHLAILLDAKCDRAHWGMGTTLTALCIRGEVATFAHAGDSRCYFVREGSGLQLTSDHANVLGLTNGLGVSRSFHSTTDIISQPIQPGDIFVLCTDGLSDYMDAAAIAATAQSMRSAAIASPDMFVHDLANMLVAKALRAGGKDNVTVVVVSVEAE